MFDLTKFCKNKNVWITSDLHISHRNLCRGTSHWDDKSGCRDFDTIEQMNDTIFNNINKVVQPNDVLIHLGDFAFGGIDNVISARKRINCSNFINILGNHDLALRESCDKWFTAAGKDNELSLLCTWVGDYIEFKYEYLFFCLFHYPMLTWNGKNHGSTSLFGHCHSTINRFENGRSMEIGLDSNKLCPYNMSDIVKIMNNIPILKDHHV